VSRAESPGSALSPVTAGARRAYSRGT
jgi:hypothetical protein